MSYNSFDNRYAYARPSKRIRFSRHSPRSAPISSFVEASGRWLQNFKKSHAESNPIALATVYGQIPVGLLLFFGDRIPKIPSFSMNAYAGSLDLPVEQISSGAPALLLTALAAVTFSAIKDAHGATVSIPTRERQTIRYNAW